MKNEVFYFRASADNTGLIPFIIKRASDPPAGGFISERPARPKPIGEGGAQDNTGLMPFINKA